MPSISNKSIADKLMMRQGKTILFMNEPPGYRNSIGTIGGVVGNDPKGNADVIQLFVKDRAELERDLPRAKKQMNPGASVWVTYYKGTSQHCTDINRDTIAEYAASIGLEGVAICSIDDDWSALRCKLV